MLTALYCRSSFASLTTRAYALPLANPLRNSVPCSRLFSSAADPNKAETPTAEKSEEETETMKEASKEEIEYNQAVGALKKAEEDAKNIHRTLLMKYADAENKRRQRVEELKKLDSKHISAFGQKVSTIYESLSIVCGTAQKKAEALSADEKVKSFTEGLVMTHGIMKNILSKHNIIKSE
jgi:molecular chaperone GrpE (heat shock protein)